MKISKLSAKKPAAPFRKERGEAQPPAPRPTLREQGVRRLRSTGVLATALRKIEKATILRALRKYQGHNTKTALYLGITRRGLYDKLLLYGLQAMAAELRERAGIMGPRTALKEAKAATMGPRMALKKGKAKADTLGPRTALKKAKAATMGPRTVLKKEKAKAGIMGPRTALKKAKAGTLGPRAALKKAKAAPRRGR